MFWAQKEDCGWADSGEGAFVAIAAHRSAPQKSAFAATLTGQADAWYWQLLGKISWIGHSHSVQPSTIYTKKAPFVINLP